MKKYFFLAVFSSFLCLAALPGCADSKQKQDVPVQKNNEQYLCPMKCSEEIFEKPGKCPVCEMNLEKITNS